MMFKKIASVLLAIVMIVITSLCLSIVAIWVFTALGYMLLALGKVLSVILVPLVVIAIGYSCLYTLWVIIKNRN